ncbi:MAG TPA: DHH family phosphoesterase, partial [Anaerolineaceae bacterium]|nr:DHH family phosphoesterase [Anaerolineaceae bacterium]
MQPIQPNFWHIAPPISPETDQALGDYPAYLRQILFNRGVKDATEACRYLACEPPDCTDAYLLKDMQIAVDRLAHAIRRQEPIAVYGDYDADGVTATALLVEALQALGGKAKEYIPNRFDEGYGLNVEALDGLAASGVHLVITVDCGIRSLKEAEHARAAGIDLIITDHHHPIDAIPCAVAVINPKQPGDTYPDKDLAGVGVAYKLAQALVKAFPEAGVQAEKWLDLVAIGTVTDLAPLTGENRSLVRAGLV